MLNCARSKRGAAAVAPTDITAYIAYNYTLLQLLDIKIHLLFYIVYFNDLLGIKYWLYKTIINHICDEEDLLPDWAGHQLSDVPHNIQRGLKAAQESSAVQKTSTEFFGNYIC